MLVSVRIAKTKSILGQLAHDFNERPSYADVSKSGDNVTVLGSDNLEVIKSVIDEQTTNILKKHKLHTENKRTLAIMTNNFNPEDLVKERRKIRSWRKDAPTHKTMIVTFCNDFYLNKDNIDRSKLDRCMLDFVNDFCNKNNCEVSYIVRHEDETTPHYHVTFTNYNSELNTTHKFKQNDLSNIQDSAGDFFSPLGIHRGIKKSDRLAEARSLYPKKDGESDIDYNYRIKKLSNVIHRSVEELHRDLPNEIMVLRVEIDSLNIKLSKNEQLYAKTKIKLNSLLESESFKSDTVTKLESRLNTYNQRIKNVESTLQNKLNEQLSVESKLNNDIKKLEEIKSLISSGTNTVKHLKNERDRLSSSRIDKDNIEVFSVKTGTLSHTNMELIRPEKSELLRKQLEARSSKLDEQFSSLNKKTEEIYKREKALEKKEKNISNEIKSLFVTQVMKNAIPFSNAIKSVAKKHLRNIDDATFERSSEEVLENMECSQEGEITFKKQ